MRKPKIIYSDGLNSITDDIKAEAFITGFDEMAIIKAAVAVARSWGDVTTADDVADMIKCVIAEMDGDTYFRGASEYYSNMVAGDVFITRATIIEAIRMLEGVSNG